MNPDLLSQLRDIHAQHLSVVAAGAGLVGTGPVAAGVLGWLVGVCLHVTGFINDENKCWAGLII